jgi:hypothetical protein
MLTVATRGLRARINEKCRDCVYDEANRGTWREQVYFCTVTDCALWDIRPMPTSENARRRAGRTAAQEAAG